jgi:hypothetical protein
MCTYNAMQYVVDGKQIVLLSLCNVCIDFVSLFCEKYTSDFCRSLKEDAIRK